VNDAQACELDVPVTADEIEGSEETAGHAFPLDTLPPMLRQYTIEAAASLPVAPEMIVLPVLTVVGAAIGNSRSIQLKADYQESASLYGAIVAETGAMKSPSLAVAAKPLQMLETDTRRLWTSDVTVEALGPLLETNPRGLLIVKDELIGWINSMNQYKRGQGSDRQFYLSAYSGAPLQVDRKGGSGSPPLHLPIPRPFLSVIGCIQPSVVPSLKTGDTEDGFMERLLFVYPKQLPVRWTNATISDASVSSYSALLKGLLENDWPGRPNPLPLPLTPGAQRFYQAWYDAHMTESETVPSEYRGFYSKLKGYCARLALIHAVASNPQTENIPEESVRAAALQIEFFKGQMRKVATLCRSVGTYSGEVQGARQAILRGIKKYGALTRREVQRKQNYNANIFGPAWDSLTIPELIEVSNGIYILNPHRQTDKLQST